MVLVDLIQMHAANLRAQLPLPESDDFADGVLFSWLLACIKDGKVGWNFS